MLKRNLLLILLLFTTLINSQSRVIEFENSLKNSNSNIKDVIPIVNQENDNVSLIIADAKNVYAYKFDKDFKLNNKLASEEKKRKYKVLIGNSIDSIGNINVFLTNKNHTSFAVAKFNFLKKEADFEEFKLLNNEKFLQSFTIKNNFYLIAGSKITKRIYIYFFENDGKFKRKQLFTNKIDFINKKGKKVYLSNLLIKSTDLKKFEENTPNSIENAAEKRKLYLRENSLVITLDENKDITQILTIEVPSLKTSYATFKKPLLKIKESKRKSNSYLNGDKLFTIAASKEFFSTEVLDYNTGEKIKNYTIDKSQKINFKNTPIIQEGGMYDNYRELEKTKKYLRKITSGEIGITAFKNNNTYHLTMGGYVTQKGGGGMFMPMGFGGLPIASFGNVSVFFNPALFAYNSMANTKSTRIESLFDSNFSHIKGEIKKNAFDKMEEHKPRNETGLTIFKHKDYYIRGFYNTYTKTYILEKFKN